jgi:hypothetical protein
MSVIEFLLWLFGFFVLFWIAQSFLNLKIRQSKFKKSVVKELILGEGEIDYKSRDCHDCRFCRPAITNKEAVLWCTHEEASKANLGYPIERNCNYWKPIRRYGELSPQEQLVFDSHNQDSFILVNNKDRGV